MRKVLAPFACSAAAAISSSMIFVDSDSQLVAKAEAMGRRLREGLDALIEMPQVGNVRGLGLMAAVEVVEDKATRRAYPAAAGIGPRLAREMRNRGVVTRVKGESILFAPPLVITADQVDRIVNVTAEAIEAVTNGTNAP